MDRKHWMTLLAAGSALCVGACGATASPPAPQAAAPASEPQPVTLASTAPPEAVSPASKALDESASERLDALEKQVSDLRNDMSLMMPALTKLVNAQQDLQQVLDRMGAAANAPLAKAEKTADNAASGPAVPVNDGTEVPQPLMPAIANPQALEESLKTSSAAPLSHNDIPPPALEKGFAAPSAEAMRQYGADDALAAVEPASGAADMPVENSPAAAAGPEEAAADAPASASAFSVSQLRFGEHASMTRLVLDADGKVPYTYELDKDGTGLTVRLPQTAWNAAAQGSGLNRSPVIDTYSAAPDGQNGTILTVRLKKPVSVSWADVLPPSGDGGNRVVMDLAPRS